MATTRPARAERGGFFRALSKAARAVFHETTGALFFLLALSWINATLRLWRHEADLWVCTASGGFAVVLIAFGVISFRAGRRVR